MKRLLACFLLVVTTAAGPHNTVPVLMPESPEAVIRSSAPTLWMDPDRGLTVGASSLISSWCSRAGSACFTQGTDANKPTAGVAKGKRVVNFDGGDYMTSTTALSAIVGASAKTTIFYIKANDLYTPGQQYVTFDSADRNWALRWQGVSYNGKWNAFNLDAALDTRVDWGSDDYDLVTMYHDGVNLCIRVNGRASSCTASGATVNLTGTLYLGAQTGPASYFNGSLRSYLTWNRVLSLSEIANIERALKNDLAFSSRLNTGIFSWIPFQDNTASTLVTDKVVSGLSLSSARNTSVITTASGKLGRGFDLYTGGTDDYVSMGSLALTNFSLCIWVNPDGYGETSTGRILSANTDALQLFLADVAGAATLQWTDGATITSASLGAAAGALGWTHLCFTRSATKCNFYHNGALSGTADQTCGTTTVGATFIGNNSGSTAAFDGKVDDLRFFNRAITPAEVSKIYNFGAGDERG